MATTITSSTLTTPYLISTVQGQTGDPSATLLHRNILLVTGAQLSALKVGSIPPVGNGLAIASITVVRRIDGDLWEVEVQAIDRPLDYTLRDLQPVTFYPRSPSGLDRFEAKRLQSVLTPVTILANCEVRVVFVLDSIVALVRATTFEQPTWNGVPVNFYGAVYSDAGYPLTGAAGTTSPASPPTVQPVTQTMQPYQAGYTTVTTVTAKRPTRI